MKITLEFRDQHEFQEFVADPETMLLGALEGTEGTTTNLVVAPVGGVHVPAAAVPLAVVPPAAQAAGPKRGGGRPPKDKPANGAGAAVAPQQHTIEQVKDVLLAIREVTGTPDLPREILQRTCGAESMSLIPPDKHDIIMEHAVQALAAVRAQAAKPVPVRDPLAI